MVDEGVDQFLAGIADHSLDGVDCGSSSSSHPSVFP